jgi:oligopeptide/dipeptide ABC transporter ATP-binding protein
VNGTPLLVVDRLVHYFHASGWLRPPLLAIDDVSFTLNPKEILGLVGESGSGKSTIGKAILRLIQPTSGRILFDGVNLLTLSAGEMRARRREIQMIFQDPYGSLNPRMTAGDIVEEPLLLHEPGADRAARTEKVRSLLAEVGLSDEHLRRYPHEFSGGQRQRISIARALATRPRLIVADEPVSALDVSVRAQVVNLMLTLRERHGISILFIAHDLALVQQTCDRVAVLYRGHLVELARAGELYGSPLHPYTKILLSATPVPVPGAGRRPIPMAGDDSTPLAAGGCPFAARCPMARPDCRTVPPRWEEHSSGHWAACHYVAEGRDEIPWKPADPPPAPGPKTAMRTGVNI